MFSIVMEYLNSGMKQQEFCSKHDLTRRIFGYWFRKYKREVPSDESFISVKLYDAPQTKPAEEMKISFPNGVVIHLLSSSPENIIRSLIS